VIWQLTIMRPVMMRMVRCYHFVFKCTRIYKYCYPGTFLLCVIHCYSVLSIVTLCYPLLLCVIHCYSVLSIVTLCYPLLLCVIHCYSMLSTVTLCYQFLICVIHCYFKASFHSGKLSVDWNGQENVKVISSNSELTRQRKIFLSVPIHG
jgi:hypothetical protein